MSGSIVLSYHTNRGTVSYSPAEFFAEENRRARLPTPPCQPRQRRPHSIHITRLPAGFVPFDLRPRLPSPEPKKPLKFRVELKRLASRENAKRVLGALSTFSSPNSSAVSTPTTASPPRSVPTTPATPQIPQSPIAAASSVRSSLSLASADPSTILARRIATGTTVGEIAMSRPSLSHVTSRASPIGSISAASGPNTSKAVAEAGKPLCAGNGISCKIVLAEPVIFLTGLDHDGTTRDSSSNAMGAIVRGKMVITVTKSVKIKSITLNFKGRGETKWPEGIPPEKTKLSEEDSFRTSVKPYFNYSYPGSESGYGSQCTYVLRGENSANSSVTNLSGTDVDSPSSATQSSFTLPIIGSRPRASTIISSKEQKRLSLSSAPSRGFQQGDSPFGPTPSQKGYKVFHPGVYEYSFEEPIDNNSPETTNLPLATVSWYLEALIQRAGTFKTNLTGRMEIPVVRSPSADSLELFEPISINRKWEDQLHYEIMISGKSFPIGSKIPIAFKLTPLAKCQVHKIKVYISENVVYHACNKKITRRDTTRKILLLEKSAGRPLGKEFEDSEVRVLRGGEPSPEERAQRRETAARHRARDARATNSEPEPLPQVSENMLGDIDLGLEQFLGQTEIEMSVQIPTCEMMKKDVTKKLAHDCSWKNVDVHHWIKIIMRISRTDTNDPTGKKRRHFEISIDSPISILSCQATQANLALPAYSEPNNILQSAQRVCGCPNAALASRASSTESVPQIPHTPNSSGNFGMDGESAQPDLARPARAHLSNNTAVQRPIHMLRNPSFNPPAFDADEPPPPIVTPPPQYDHVIGTPGHDGLADYFARLSDFEDHGDTDDEDAIRASNRGRVNVVNPRTPGGRIARSMDIDRRTLTLNPLPTNQRAR